MGDGLGSRPMAMSIDVEDWFQVENLRRAIPVDRWSRCGLRVERMMDRMLGLLDESDVRATCFVLGWVAERAPGLVRRIHDAGHEVAAHGYGHQLIGELTPSEFRDDVVRCKAMLEDITGRRVRGYRAPCLSLTDWALPILHEVGFDYDSSYCPTTLRGLRYGAPAHLEHGITEVPLPCLTVGGQALPWAGGGYFRALPYRVFVAGVMRIVHTGTPYVFFIHPWELDVAQPRVGGLTRLERTRHYTNLSRTEQRWSRLLRDFDWTTIEQLVGAEPTSAAPEEMSYVYA